MSNFEEAQEAIRNLQESINRLQDTINKPQVHENQEFNNWVKDYLANLK